MAIAYVSSGAAATGSTSLSIPYPASPSAGDLIIVGIASKSTSSIHPITVSGFTFICTHRNPAGTVGANSGPTEFWLYYKESDGTETGNISCTLTGGNRAVGRALLFSKGSGNSWDVSSFTTNTGSGGTSVSITGAAGIDLAVGDWMLTASSSARGNATASAHAFTATGATFGTVTERFDNANSSSPGVWLVGATAEVTAGSSNTAPVYTFTASGSTGSVAGGFLRLREVASGTTVDLSGSPATATAAAVAPTVIIGGGNLNVASAPAVAVASAILTAVQGAPLPVSMPLAAGPELLFVVTIADLPIDPGDVSIAAPRLIRQFGSGRIGRQIAAPTAERQVAAPSIERQVAAPEIYRQDRDE